MSYPNTQINQAQDPQRGLMTTARILSLIGGILGGIVGIVFDICGIINIVRGSLIVNYYGRLYSSIGAEIIVGGSVMVCLSVFAYVMLILNIIYFVKVTKSQGSGRTTYEFFYVDNKTNPVGWLIANILMSFSALCVVGAILNLVASSQAKGNPMTSSNNNTYNYPSNNQTEQSNNATNSNSFSAVCPKCGKVNDKNSRFCSQCGADMTVSQPSDSETEIFCSQCGKPNKKGNKFCSSCGAKLIQ